MTEEPRTSILISAPSPLRWQMALCYLAFTATYLMYNTIPYAPFMTVKLLPERATSENVGKYSAFFTSCFIWGRSAGSSKWGEMADSRGRLPVLYLNLIAGSLFTMAFGLSNNYFVALAMRFLLGSLCEMGGVLKTCVSELAGTDRELEAKSMNLVISAWAAASLVAPAIGGALSDPVKQFPNSFLVQHSSWVHQFLSRFPYILPNVVGAVLCLIGILVIKFNLRETLVLQPIQESGRASSENDPLLETSQQQQTNNNFDDSVYVLSPEAIELATEQDMEDTAIRDAYMLSNDLDGLITTAHQRKAIYCPKKHHDEEQQDDATTGPPSVMAFLRNTENRNHIIVYFIGTFLITFNMEVFPLFCLSQTAGLGVSENTIGGIMLASGLTHAALQPSIYSCIFARRGLYGSVQWSAVLFVPVLLIIPFADLSRGVGSDDLRWTALIFLGIVTGLGKVFTVTFISSMSVSLNRLVPPQQRATFNGLLTKITGQCRGMAPVMAGLFVSWAFTSGIVPPKVWSAELVYATLGLIGVLLAAASFLLLDNDDET